MSLSGFSRLHLRLLVFPSAAGKRIFVDLLSMRSLICPLGEERAQRHVQLLLLLFVGFAQKCHLAHDAFSVFWA